jgi:RNA polymerase primary sigma factor
MRPLLIDPMITSRSADSLNRYLVELDKIPLLKAEDEIFLCKKIKEGDRSALDRLVKCNLRFVVSCAKKYQHLGLPLSDLINEGNIGLIRAARMFDESKGFKFISYAVWWIRQSMMMALTLDVRVIRLPQNMVKITSEIRKTSELLEQELERIPTHAEICERIHIPSEKIALENAFGKNVSSLDNSVQHDNDSMLWTTLADSDSLPADHVVMAESYQNEIEGILSLVTERERKILRGTFGFENGIPESLEDLGRQLGMSTERVRQLKLSALHTIRKKIQRSGRMYDCD